MKPTPKIALFLAATCLAFFNSATAQVQTFHTQTGYTGSVQVFGTSGAAARKAQVFTDIESVAKLTYNFFAGSGGSPLGTTQSAQFTAKFGEWGGSNLVNTLVDFGTFTIPPNSNTGVGGWSSTLSETGESFSNFSQTFDFTDSALNLDPVFGFQTDPAKSYALLLTLTNGTASTNIGLGVNESDFYLGLDGDPLLFPNGYFGSPTSGQDYVFSQISIVPTAVPEASTVAAMIGGAFIAGLVGLRLRQRRQLAIAPAHNAPVAA
jgi:hypothetical protein